MVSNEQMMHFYEQMVLIRKFETRANEGFTKGKIHGSLHTGIGQEACPVGVVNNLTKDDYIFGTHREHGAALAKGLDPNIMMAELYAKAPGYCHGKSGSMHIASVEHGHLGANGILGAGNALACGAAFANKYKGIDGRVTVSFFGDGSSNAGYLHESMNLAAIWELPVIFCCHNNNFAISTPWPTVSKTKDIASRAAGYEMPSIIINGMDVLEVYEKMGPVIEYVRSGKGPYFVELKTYRFAPHSKSDREVYRTKEEVKEWMKKCPILTLGNLMKSKGLIDDAKIQEIDEKYEKVIDDAVAFADAAPEPDISELLKDVYYEEAK